MSSLQTNGRETFTPTATSTPPAIRRLPSAVIAQIKSSVLINHLNDVVFELVKNALDANARSVAITINFQKGGCTVEDDGTGIPVTEFKEGGGLAKRHCACCCLFLFNRRKRSSDFHQRYLEIPFFVVFASMLWRKGRVSGILSSPVVAYHHIASSLRNAYKHHWLPSFATHHSAPSSPCTARTQFASPWHQSHCH